MYSLFIFIFLSFLTFHLITKKYLNPYKLIMVFGKKGSGKTTFLSKIAIKEIKRGKVVYSTIDIPGTILFKVEDIGKYTFLENSVVLIDEVGMIWDNRDFKNFKPEVRDFFKLQRHDKVKVYLFSQTFDIDKKLRDLTDQMFLLRNHFRVFSIARRIDKRITISNSSQNTSGESKLVDEYNFAPLLSPSSYIITFIPRYIEYFNSYEKTKLPQIQGKHIYMTEAQQYHVKTCAWMKDSVVSSLSHLFGKVSNLRFDNLTNRPLFDRVKKHK